MYMRSYKRRDIQVPDNYSGIAFAEESESPPEEGTGALPLTDAPAYPELPPRDRVEPPPFVAYPEDAESVRATEFPDKFGLSGTDPSDLLLVVLAVLLLKERPQDTEIPLILLLLLLSGGDKNTEKAS